MSERRVVAAFVTGYVDLMGEPEEGFYEAQCPECEQNVRVSMESRIGAWPEAEECDCGYSWVIEVVGIKDLGPMSEQPKVRPAKRTDTLPEEG